MIFALATGDSVWHRAIATEDLVLSGRFVVGACQNPGRPRRRVMPCAARKEDAATYTVVELCGGGGGLALGLESAGFQHIAVIEIDPDACRTLRSNRSAWPVVQEDVRKVDARPFYGVDLVAGGVPCPPFSIAGKQLGEGDERDLFPAALRIIRVARPRAIFLENVPGLATTKFRTYLGEILDELRRLGYVAGWRVLNASDFGVPQSRPRFLLVGVRRGTGTPFRWPTGDATPRAVGDTLYDLMAARGWPGAHAWRMAACATAPTIVGGSKKHGGADLGPTRSRQRWAELHVEGISIADQAPDETFPIAEAPRLTTQMVARIQGFPDSWQFAGRKTAVYRQIGNALPPPVAEAVGRAIIQAIAVPARGPCGCS